MTISNEKISFSIVIPTYNHASYINRCIDSLMSQTYTDWEAIIVNNFSEDNTIELIEAYKDQRLKIINYRNNGIIGASRNIGIKNSKYEWICFLDSDDWWYSNKLEVVYKYITNNPHVDVICHDLIMNNSLSGKKKLMRCGPVVPNLYCDLLKFGNRFFNSALAIKKSSLEKYKIMVNESKEIFSVEDYDFCLQLASCNSQFACVNLPLGEYTAGISNISNTKIHIKNHEYLLRKHVFEIQTFEPNGPKLWGEVVSQINILNAIVSFRQNRYRDSINYLLMAIKTSRSDFFKYACDRIVLYLKKIHPLKIDSHF
jgi:glycosyltransferase involved in cell wall biosynthesis